MKISVIIPVYNAEKYLENALLSVINQTLTDIEIILVNDGSTDGSLRIIEQYAAKDHRIVVINKQNQGVAKARADGVAISKGAYIQTMDNDDYMYPDALEKLYNKAVESGADMVVGRSLFYIVDENREFMDSRIDFDEITGIELFSLICGNRACWATWTRLHKAEIYREKKILVSEEINRVEDVYLTAQLCYYAKKVVSIDDVIIQWFIRRTSLSNNRKMSDKERNEFIIIPNLVKGFFNSKGISAEIESDLMKLNVYFYQERLLRGDIKGAMSKCKEILKLVGENPELKNVLAPKMIKIIETFQRYSFLGYLRLWKYRIFNLR